MPRDRCSSVRGLSEGFSSLVPHHPLSVLDDLDPVPDLLLLLHGEGKGERGLQGAEPYVGVRVVEQLVEADCALEGESFHEVESEVGDVLPDALKFRSEGGSFIHRVSVRLPIWAASAARARLDSAAMCGRATA